MHVFANSFRKFMKWKSFHLLTPVVYWKVIQSTCAPSNATYLELSPCGIKISFPWVLNYDFPMISVDHPKHLYIGLFTTLNRFSGLVLIICLMSRTLFKRVQYKKRVPRQNAIMRVPMWILWHHTYRYMVMSSFA